MANYWCANFGADTETRYRLRYGLGHDLWLMQYQYGRESDRAIALAWKLASQVNVGDWLVAYLNGSRCFAFGQVIEPRTLATHLWTVDKVLSEREHPFTEGIVRFSDAPALYEDLRPSNGYKSEKGDLFAQRIDVEEWRHQRPDGVSLPPGFVDSVNAAHGSIRRPLIRITEGYFEAVKKALSEGPGDRERQKRRSEPRSYHRNAPWTADELILALELYMRNPANPPGKASSEVAELSGLLNQLAKQLGAKLESDYRNANGVYMKMMNFRRFDPTFITAGKTGLTRGNKIEESVWNGFAADVARLRAVATAIRSTVESGELVATEADQDDDTAEAVEGRILTKLHRVRERKGKAVRIRKQRELARSGRLRCEACSFDFVECYGERGAGYIEAHHSKPLHTLTEATVTKPEDLDLLCANCHRVIHSRQPWLTLSQLRELLSNKPG